MSTVHSKDGTIISYERIGSGPVLVLVGGAFEQRRMDSETAKIAAHPLLAEHFSIIHYDRRGRGESSDTQPFAVQREIEDIEALIDQQGDAVCLFGISSGAALALEAAVSLGGKVKKVAIYEPPYNDDLTAQQAWRDYRAQLDQVLAEGRRGDAVGLFMMLVGVPAEYLPEMQQDAMWPVFEAVAPTLAYDAAALGESAAVPTELAARLAIPALVIDGSETYPFIQESSEKLVNAMRQAQHIRLDGQNHEVQAEAIVPLLVNFFEGV